jgi:hypothetical protein
MLVIRQIPLFHQEVAHRQFFFPVYPRETSSAIASPTEAGMVGSEQERLAELNRLFRERDSLSQSCCLESRGPVSGAFHRTIERVLNDH